MSLPFSTIEDSLEFIDSSLANLDLYEFGVFAGSGLRRIISGFNGRAIPIRQVWGFDSFEGLNEEDPKVWHNPEWTPKAFSILHDFNLGSVEEAVSFVYNQLKSVRPADLSLLAGWFSETLTQESVTKHQMGPAGYIHVDADLYSSSLEALDFCFSNHLVTYGTIIRFDDIASTPTNAGQHLAWARTKSKYEVEFDQLSYNVFRILYYQCGEPG